ncbi:MAG: hypothetical protein JSV21_06885 [Nitrospirota bacterium]|nr:MAG: hypothetical protein JSV21_06885 [Nitrospirota bacterium]
MLSGRLNLKLLIFLTIISVIIIQLPRHNEPEKYPTFHEFARDSSFPYKADPERIKLITRNYNVLSTGLTMKQVKNNLGSPDFAQKIYKRKHKELSEQIGTSWTYLFTKPAANFTFQNSDSGIEVFFNIVEEVVCIVPVNVDGLQVLTGPENDKCPSTSI